MKKTHSVMQVISFLCVVLLFVLYLMTPVQVYAANTSWNTVFMRQRTIDHWSGCTVCSVQLMLQNSQTLLSEWQLSGQQSHSHYNDGSAYDKFNKACASNIASGTGTNAGGRTCSVCGQAYSGKTHVSDSVIPGGISAWNSKCISGTNWVFLTGESTIGSESAKSNGSNYVVGLGSKDFKAMSYSELVSAMKLFWNAGYWVCIGLTYGSGGSQLGPGPSGYTSDHWVMLAGVDDSDFYINDPAYNKVDKWTSWSNYSKVVHLALFKNGLSSPLTLAGGQTLSLGTNDYGNLNGLGLSDSTINGVSPSLNISLSDASLMANMRLQEINYEDLFSGAEIDNLSQVDLEMLEGWKTNINADKNESGFISVLRWIVSFVGILITIWGLLIYLAFWFDHINSFVYLDALHIVTLGQLHICPPGEKPTFSLGKGVNNKTVSHLQILCICITAILFGALLISGLFYTLVARLVQTVMDFFR